VSFLGAVDGGRTLRVALAGAGPGAYRVPRRRDQAARRCHKQACKENSNRKIFVSGLRRTVCNEVRRSGALVRRRAGRAKRQQRICESIRTEGQ